MSHRITYLPSGILLSSQIGEIGIYVDGTAVDVTLTASTGQLTILSERYYAYVGNVKLYDIGSLIEAEMQGSGLSYATFTLTVGNGTAVASAKKYGEAIGKELRDAGIKAAILTST